MLLAAALVLWVGPALGQDTPTVTISLTGSVDVTEGDSATAFSVTVANVPQDSTANYGLVVIEKSGGVTSGDFDLYDSDPGVGSPTALNIVDAPSAALPNLYVIKWSAVSGVPSTETTYNYWIKVPDDSVLLEGDESIKIKFAILGAPSLFPLLAESETLTLNVTDAPLPAPTGKPTTPANLKAAAGRGAVTLTWDAVDATSSNTNLVNDLQIDKHQYCQKTDTSACGTSDWSDIASSAYGEVNANTYTVGSLTNSTEYTFRVRAVNECAATMGCGISDASTAVMATPAADARARPTGLAATATGSAQVTLTWTDPEDATITFYEYQQKEGLAGFGDWTVIPDSSATTTSYRLTGLDNGTAYVYRIRAGRGSVTSLPSAAVTVTPQAVPPAAPVLTAIPRLGGVTLSWPNPRDPTIELYEYQYKSGAGTYQPWRTARLISESECVFAAPECAPPYFDPRNATWQIAVGGLTNGTLHTFRIRAVNDDGATISNEVSATPALGVPAKLTGVTTSVVRDAFFVRALSWDRVEDPSILRYEFTVDEGRTWSFLGSPRIYDGRKDRATFERDDYQGHYTFRIRAVNAGGPGPASEPAVEVEDPETVATARRASNVSVEWDSSTRVATLVWDAAADEDDDLRVWSVFFRYSFRSWNTVLPIATTRYRIPGAYNAGTSISVIVAGCLRSVNCGSGGLSTFEAFRLGRPPQPSGFSATPGDQQITLAWDAATDSTITHFEYETAWTGGQPQSRNGIPDGDDNGSSRADETSHTVTIIRNVSGHTEEAPRNGYDYRFRLRARSAHGAGAWTEWITVTPLAKGVPGALSGLVSLLLDDGESLTTWDDPQDPSITGYQMGDTSRLRRPQDIPGSDATTTGVYDLPIRAISNLGFVRAVNANGVGPWTRTTVVESPAPARPTGLRAAPGSGRVTLTWDDPGPGVYIQSWRYTTDDGATWTDIPDSQTTPQGHLTRYVVTGLDNGQTYTCVVQAVNNRGTSPLSAAATATLVAGVPAQPTGLSAVPGATQAVLTWDDPGDASITKYQIKQDSAAWADIASSDADTTSHTVSSLTNGTSYTFRIRAVNDHNGDSTDDPGTASEAVSVTPGLPTAPASFSVAPGNAQATLTWRAPASDGGSVVTGYEYTSNAGANMPIWRDVPDSGSDGRADEREYTVSSLTNNTPYTFAVRAENANGQGAASPTVRATPAASGTPQRPAAFRAEPGHQRVRLTWTLPSFQHPVDDYQYRQSTDGGTTWTTWTTISNSDADTAEHTVTSLDNGTPYTFELRARKNGTAGPAARAQATPNAAVATRVITPESSGEIARFVAGGRERLNRNTHTFTTPDGRSYTVTRLLLPDGLDWRITVPGTTDIDKRTFTLLSLQGGTPETSPRYTFTSTGQEGLDISVERGPDGHRCKSAWSPAFRSCAWKPGQPAPCCCCASHLTDTLPDDGRHGVGRRWTPYLQGRHGVRRNVSGFSAFVLGYRGPAGYNEAPTATAAPHLRRRSWWSAARCR